MQTARAEPNGLERDGREAYDDVAGVGRAAALGPLLGSGGGARFARAEERDLACQDLARDGFLVIELEGIGPSVRGRLGEVIDEAIERELRSWGATAPGLSSAAMAEPTQARCRSGDAPPAPGIGLVLGDQLYRARRAGAAGIAVVLGPLRAAAGPSGALDPEDCGALRSLASAAADCALVLILDARDAGTGGYGDPVSLESLLATTRPAAVEPRATTRLAESLAPSAQESKATDGAALERPAPMLVAVDEDTIAERRALVTTPQTDRPTGPARPAGRAAEEALKPSTEAPSFDESWRAWTLALAAARGPQPLAALERLFAESYVPLQTALAAGLEDGRARAAHDDFRNTFLRSYTDAFPTFAATTKRPRMVLDVHEMAARIARLHGARSTRLLLVDAMRWDLSRLVAERVTMKLGSRAALTDEVLLWSALPTRTMRQLETIARGVEALRAPGELEPDGEPPRGRTSEYIRRMRVGPRELHKLDLVEMRLQAARGIVGRSIPDIAEATADVIARHADSLSPHTLLFVFGDHGFTIDRSGSAQQGGASPEEVLVGAFALLVGDVH